MGDDLKGLLDRLRHGDGYDQRAADEITSLRERLEKAELLSEHHERMEYRRGFRAGIEAAAERVEKIGFTAQFIRALSPTDNTTTVAEAAKVLLDARSPDGLTVLPNYVMILLRALAAQAGGE